MRIARLIIGNVWLMAALVMVLGKTDTGNGEICTFFNIGGWHYAATYIWMIVLCVFVAILNFGLSWKKEEGEENK
jgi:prepilin signal peptidase PulO-like enzyme (type II secretory pathway)